MGFSKNKTYKKRGRNKTIKKGGKVKTTPTYIEKQFLDNFQKQRNEEEKMKINLQKQNPKMVFVNGRDLKSGCTYKFIDPSVYGKEFTVKTLTKDPDRGPKTADGEEYFLQNEGWWIKEYPIGGNNLFIFIRCGGK